MVATRSEAAPGGWRAKLYRAPHGAWFARNLQSLRGHFTSADPRTLALFRIVLGVLLMVDLGSRFDLVGTLYSNDGVLSNHFALFRPLAPYQFSLYTALSSSRDVSVAFALTMVVYALFTVGYRTRLFHLLSFLCVTSLHARNLMTELPSDTLLHVWVGWSLFLPLGARFSIDGVRRSLTACREQSVDELNEPPRDVPAMTSIAVFGMLLQLSVVHLAAALRQAGPAWRDGTALYYALHQNWWVTDLGVSVGQNASFEQLRIASFAYRTTEAVIGVLVLVPSVRVRRVALALVVAFHLLGRAFFDMGLYEWVMAGTATFLVSSRDWDAVRTWYVRRKPRLTVQFHVASGLNVACCRLLKRLDLLSRLTFVASDGDVEKNAMGVAPASEMPIVRDEARGKTFTGVRAVGAILGALPFGKPLAMGLLVPGVSWLTEQTFARIERHQAEIEAWFGLRGFAGEPRRNHECGHGGPVAEPVSFNDSIARRMARFVTFSRETAAVCALAVCAVALVHDIGDDNQPPGIEAAIYPVIAYPRIFQRWGLFAPEPAKRPGMLVAEGQTTGGARLDPFTGLPLARRSGERDPREPRPDPLMSAYFTNISQPSHATYVGELREYVRRLGEGRGAKDKLVWFNVDWIESPIAPPQASPQLPALAVGPAARRITSGP